MGVGEKHLEAFLKSSQCKVKYICDINPSKIKILTKKYPDIEVIEDYKKIIYDKDIDLVSIASFDEFHYSQIKECIKYNKHIIAEKPICLYKKELSHLNQLLKRKPKIFFGANMVLRTNPLFKKIRSEIQNNSIGNVFHIEADYNWGRVHKLTNGWRNKSKYYSIILGAAVHMVDLTVWMLGKLPKEVIALDNFISTENTNFRFASFSVLILRFENGLTVKINANGGCKHPHFHEIKVFGSKKTITHSLNGSYKIDQNMKQIIYNKKYAYPAKNERKKLILSFINNLKSKNSTNIISKNEIFDVMCICFTAIETLKTKKLSDIKYI